MRRHAQDDASTIRNLTEILQAQETSSYVIVPPAGGSRVGVAAGGQDILAQFLAEAVMLSLIGGFFGIVLAIGIFFSFSCPQGAIDVACPGIAL